MCTCSARNFQDWYQEPDVNLFGKKKKKKGYKLKMQVKDHIALEMHYFQVRTFPTLFQIYV